MQLWLILANVFGQQIVDHCSAKQIVPYAGGQLNQKQHTAESDMQPQYTLVCASKRLILVELSLFA